VNQISMEKEVRMSTEHISQPRTRRALAAVFPLTRTSIGAEFLAADHSHADPPAPAAEADRYHQPFGDFAYVAAKTLSR